MSRSHTSHARARAPWILYAWAALVSVLFAGPASAALTLSPARVTVPVSGSALVTISGASGEIQAESKNTAVATVALSNRTTTGATLTVRGVGAGSTTVYVRDAKSINVALAVTVVKSMTVSPTSLTVAIGSTGKLTASSVSGTMTASSANTGVATVSVSSNVVTVKGVTAGSTLVSVKDSKVTVTVPITVTGGSTSTAKYSLIAWNDLGMHCMDGKDYSVFSILPPYNNLNAQLVNASTGKAVTSGVTLTYEAVADATGSINTTSVNKTEFWTHAKTLYGAQPASDVGLTGNATPSRTAQPMVFNADHAWFEATGLPITPYDDAGAKNYYPMVKVVARDGTGKVLATTSTVLPVSDEITCAACHATPTDGTTNKARLAAKPAGDWEAADMDPERNWKKNILKLHDEKQWGNAAYQSALTVMGRSEGLYKSAINGKPALCAACHGSNALPGTGRTGISKLTSALHTNHGKVVDPKTMLSLDSATNREACYLCHPGSVTRCLRGAMGKAVNPDGTMSMGCQSCHGNMSNVGKPARVGWLEQPNCQACHFDGKRTLSAVDASGNLIKVSDTRFATNPNVPATGFSLFRFSKGHGGLQCEACHGSTHAEYPSSHVNDNVQSIALQGYEDTVRECTVCHATPPLSATGGPHGMHTIGATWVSKHESYAEGNASSCAYCHGSDYRGSPLAQVKAARTYPTKSGSTRTYKAGDNVGCYDCHNGPNP
jgi:hypothetical protein